MVRRRELKHSDGASSSRSLFAVPKKAATAFVLAVLLLVMTAGCEESVDPIIGSEHPFTIWGFMNAGADTQRVRVYAISEALVLNNPSEEIDARVYSTDLTTGERREWTYKTVYFDSLNTGHTFWSPFRAEHEHRYRLEVVRSDGATSIAEVTVPGEVEIEIDVDADRTTIPIQIEGDVPNLIGPKVTYHAINVPPTNAYPPGTQIHPPVLHPVVVAYDDRLERRGNSWEIVIDMIQDTTAVWNEYRSNCLITPAIYSAPNIWLREMDFSVVIADSTWNPPGGVFDPDLLAVPGTFSNVENGYGFFGAGEGVRFLFVPSPEVRERAGYSFQGRCPSPPGPLDIDYCKFPPIPCIGENIEDLWQLWLR